MNDRYLCERDMARRPVPMTSWAPHVHGNPDAGACESSHRPKNRAKKLGFLKYVEF